MSGSLKVIGLGPGPAQWIVPEAETVLNHATDIVGYQSYLDRVPDREGRTKHASDNRVELERAHHAIDLAKAGRDVVVVSGGDPGVFAMAAAVFEAIEERPEAERDLDVHVVPGVSAMFAAAARLGAPLGHDFCAISLSDNLKPWDVIARRLRAAAWADFVIALYNPISKARPNQLGEALAILRESRPPATILVFARAVGRPGERILLTTLAEAKPDNADMSTVVLVGSTETRTIQRPSQPPWVFTPRSYGRPR